MLPCWIASSRASQAGATISAKSSASTSQNPIACNPNRLLRPPFTRLAFVTTMADLVPIAANGTAPVRAVTLRTRKASNTFVHIASSKTTPLALARLALRRPPQPIDYLLQLPHLSRRTARFRPPFLRLLPPQQPYRRLLRSPTLFPLPLPHFLANFYSLVNTRTPQLFVTFFAPSLRSRTPLALEILFRRS